MGDFQVREELTGQKFNMLTVLNYMHTDQHNKAHWLCECDCGQLKIISAAELRNGQKSCGCVRGKPLDLVGEKFGRWTVLERAENDKHGKKRFLCECMCGSQKIVDGSSLRQGLSKSCGCLAPDLKEIRSKKKTWKNVKTCKFEGCSKKHHSKGWCKKHYSDFYHGRMNEDGIYKEDYKPVIKGKTCRFPGCKSVGTKKNSLRSGLCNKHRKWAEKGIIDKETCEIIDPKRVPKQKEHIHCKVSGCLKKVRRNGFCEGHSSSYRARVIDINGNRMYGKRSFNDYSKRPKCCVRTCDFTATGESRETRLVKGFCPYHYDLHKKGYYNEFGMMVKEKDFLTREEHNKRFAKWAKKAARERAIKITWDGETKTIKTWSRITKIKPGTIKGRYKAGMPPELIFVRGDLRRSKEYKEWVKNKKPS